MAGRGVITGGGNACGNFYIVNGFSNEYIESEFAKMAQDVFEAYRFFESIFGDTDYARDCAGYCVSRKFKGESLRRFVKACQIALDEVGSGIRLMVGIPAHYGTMERAYFHNGQYSDDDALFKTRNQRYGKFYYPCFSFSDNGFFRWGTKGILSDDDMYFRGYDADKEEVEL